MQYKFCVGIFFFIVLIVPLSSAHAGVWCIGGICSDPYSGVDQTIQQLQLQNELNSLQQTQSNQATINRLKLQYGYAAYSECISTNFDYGNQYEVAIQFMAAESCMANYQSRTQREQQVQQNNQQQQQVIQPSNQRALEALTPWTDRAITPQQTTQAPVCTANATYNGSQCICNTGYFSDSGACITGAQSCINNYGSNSVYNSADNSCDCVSGFVWDSGQATCVKTATTVVTPTVKKTTKNNSESASVLNGVTNAIAQTDNTSGTNATTTPIAVPQKGFWSRLFHALNPFSWF